MEDNSNYTRIQELHKISYDCISKALDADGNANGPNGRRRAVELYRKGIKELEKGLAIPTVGLGEKRERVAALKEKMHTNLLMAKDRVSILEEEQPSGGRKTFASPKKFKAPLVPAAKPSPASDNGCDRPSRPNFMKPQARTPRRNDGASQSPARKGAAGPKSSTEKAEALKIKRAKAVKGIDNAMANAILDQILDLDGEHGIQFNDVYGLEKTKRALKEAVILPAYNPEMFTGLLEPVHGILLFGPPGNGKTMLAKAVAREAKHHFFNISASSLTSKWVGEAEKLVKALFVMARNVQPSIIFIDEIDSVLCERSEKENEASRRLKTEFLLQFDGVGTDSSDKLLVMGATNRPFDLDEAVLRRFPRRIQVPQPDEDTRGEILRSLLRRNGPVIPLSEFEIRSVAQRTSGYSASDLTNLAKEAAMGPIRDHSLDTLKKLKSAELRPISINDFDDALRKIRASCDPKQKEKLIEFNEKFGDIS